MRRKAPRREKMSAETREAVMRRDGYLCQARALGFGLEVECRGRLHVHHRLLLGQGGTHDPDNLLSLCDAHHRHAHDVDRAGAEATGVIIRGVHH